jgi:YHS domain-containing protein
VEVTTMALGSDLDPVCGMSVSRDEGVSLFYEGRELRFCSEDCRQEFLRRPRTYLDIPSSPDVARMKRGASA